MKLTMTDSVREISILLVTARDNSAISAADIADHMPMGLGHIASYIKKNSKHKVSIIDVPHEDVDFEYLKNYIIKNKIELVGISAMVNNYIFCVDFSHYLRKFFPYTKLKVRWHDWLLYLVALELGKKWFIDNQAHALYRLHNNNDTGQITSLKQFWDRLIYVISGNFFCEVSLLASFRTDEISETIRANGIFAFLKVIFLIFSIERNTLSKVSIVASLISYKTKSLFKGNR